MKRIKLCDREKRTIMKCRKKRLMVFLGAVLTAGAFLGCAASNSNLNTGDAEHRYHPKLPPGIETLDAVKKDLEELLGSKQRLVGITFGSGRYYSKNDLNLYANNAELVALNMGGTGGVSRSYDSNGNLKYFLFKRMTVLDDRIEICPRISLYYADLMQGLISVKSSNDKYPYLYTIQFRDQISFHFHKEDMTGAQRFADDLFFIQHLLKKQQDDRRATLEHQLSLFEPLAAKYRALDIKPPVPEEQRRLIVQANVLNQRKDYAGAIGLYLKAIDLDPVSYPGAYFNLALLSAQLQRYPEAIAYMKQYLLLVPEAKDARSAQDKIYEWEFMMPK